MLFPVALVLVTQALLIQANILSQKYPGDDIEALCKDKSVELTTVSQLKRLGQAAGALICSSKVKNAISDLIFLIEGTHSDLCSLESVNKLKSYYTKHLDTSANDLLDEERLPKSLKRFAIAYGMRVSNECKKSVIEVLSKEAQDLLYPDDFKPFDSLISDGSPLGQVLSSLSDQGEILLPGDLAPLLRTTDSPSSNEQIFVQTPTGPYVRKLQAICERRFKPIYEPLMEPLVKLANTGFYYKDNSLKCNNNVECPGEAIRPIGHWSMIVYICEALANFRIVEDRNVVAVSKKFIYGESEGKMVRILTKEEAEAIEGPHSESEYQLDLQELVRFKLRPVSFDADLIFDKSDSRLVRATKSLKTDKSEQDIIRRRMVKKATALVKHQMRHGHFGLVLSAAWKRLVRKSGSGSSGSSRSPSEPIVKSINEIIEIQEGLIKPTVHGFMRVPLSEFDTFEKVVLVIFVGLIIFSLGLCFG